MPDETSEEPEGEYVERDTEELEVIPEAVEGGEPEEPARDEYDYDYASD